MISTTTTKLLQKLKYLINTSVKSVICLIICNSCFSQTKEETTQLINQLTKTVYSKGEFNTDCSSFNYKHDVFEGLTVSVKIGTCENRYNNIPWKDFELVNIDNNQSFNDFDVVSVFFKVPIPFHMIKDYTISGYTDKDIVRTLRCIPMTIQKNQFGSFEKACQRLKILESGGSLASTDSRIKLTAITQLPSVAYCEKIPPPTVEFVVSNVFFTAAYYDKSELENQYIEYLFQEELLKAIGAKISENTTGSELKEYYVKLKEYWNHYSYSFTYDGQTGALGSDFRSTLLEEGLHSMNDDVRMFIGYKCKANINFLNPFSGRSYLDNYYTEYSDKAHSSWAPASEHDSQDEINSSEYEIEQARLGGAKHSSEMVLEYQYNTLLHDELIAAIICNSKGEGIFSNLGDQPGKYFSFLYQIGLRDFSEAVLLFESVYSKKLSVEFKNEEGKKHNWN